MAAGRHLPDLSTLVRRFGWRRGGGPRGDHGTARSPRGAQGRGDLAVADLHVADGRLRLRRLGLLRRRPRVRHVAGPGRAGRGLPRARHQARARLGPEPQLRPAPVVQGVARQPRQPQARLVRVARRQRRRPAQRLDVGLQGLRPGMDLRRDDAAVLPALVHARAAGPQLGKPRGRRRDARRPALLDGPRRRRVAPRRDRQDRQGPAAARSQAGFAPSRRGLGDDPRAPARDPQSDRRIRRPDDRGGGGAAGPPPRRRLPRVRRPAAPRAQLRLHRPGLGRGDLRHLDRGLRGACRGSRVAGVVSLQPRQPSPRLALRPRRPRATAGTRDPAHALRPQRHAVHLPGGGARAARRADPARAGRRRRRPRPRARPDPLDARCARPRLHHGRRLAAVRGRGGDAQRADAGRGPTLDPQPRAHARADAPREPDAADRRAARIRRRPGHPGLDARTGRGRRSWPPSTSPRTNCR